MIHPFVIYFKEAGELKHLNYVIISECKTHYAVAFYLFITNLIKMLQTKFSRIDKIIYMTDGTGAQYKNRHNFINLYMHQLDFGIVAEWHFHATAHGKGPYDGIGGTIKRKAARESLTRPLKNQITNAKQLFDQHEYFL